MMIDKILVPLDESALAECTLPHAISLVNAFNAQVILLHVLEQSNTEEQSQLDPLEWHLRKVEAQTYLDGVSERLRSANLQPETILLEGPAADRIIEYAREHEIDLIILSSHGRSGLSGWNVSSVVQKVIHRANKSLMIVRAYQIEESHNGRDYRRILVPLDGSQRAESVLPLATRLVQQQAAELIVVHVVARPEMLQRTPLTPDDQELVERLVERNQAEANRYFEQLQLRLAIPVQTRLLVSDSAMTALHELVEQEQMDLVMLSAHGHTGESHRPYGSTVTSFITYGATPLLIFQDLPPQQIEPTRAEVVVKSNDIRQGRTVNHA